MAILAIIFTAIVGFVSFLALSGAIYRNLIAGGKCYSKNRIDGKTVLITGASAGIGKAAAEELARRGGRIIMGCRNLSKGTNVAKRIMESTGNKNVIVMKIDVADLNSVRNFVEEFKQKEKCLDILINNAGAGFGERLESPQGFELTYATNHLGPFLLTVLLLDIIKTTGKARIINVSSIAHKYTNLDFDDIQFKRRKFGSFITYAQSKLCNVLFTNEIARKLYGTGITCNSLHPGAVATEIMNKNQTIFEKFIFYMFSLLGKTCEQGAQTTIFLAVADEVENISGEYFVDCKIDSTSRESKNKIVAEKLWNLSEIQVELNTGCQQI